MKIKIILEAAEKKEIIDGIRAIPDDEPNFREKMKDVICGVMSEIPKKVNDELIIMEEKIMEELTGK